MFDRYATYNGSSPYETPGIMSIIQHLEHSFGTFIPEDGMDSIAKHLYNLANDLDVEFFFNEAIEDGKKVRIKEIEKEGMWGIGTPEDLNYFLEHYKGDF